MSRRDTQWPRAPDIEGATDDNTDPKVGKEKKVKNPYKIPTAACLGTSIPVLSVHVWDVFEALEYCNHQGNDYEGRSFISRKRLEPGTDRLYVIKQHEPKVKIHLSHLRKPSCEQLVTLHHTFRHADSICFVYEEMDASLYQILQIDDHPDTSPDQRRNEIAAICKQVLLGLQYLHCILRIAHNDLSSRNILVNRHGRVKLANVGQSMLWEASTTEVDILQLKQIVSEMYKHEQPTEETEISFLQVLAAGNVNEAIKHDFLENPDYGCLSKSVVRAKRLIFDPPHLISVA